MKNQIVVYRVENKSGYGPYMSNNLGGEQREAAQWLNMQHQIRDDIRHKRPIPWSDGISNWNGDDYCGFHGIKKLREWFTKEELNKLSAAGFQVTKYKVSKDFVIAGKRQVMFKRHLAKKVTTVNPLPVKA